MPLSAAAQVTPDPEVVLNVTVKAPVVALSTIKVFSIESGIVTLTAPPIVPTNFRTAFLPFDNAPLEKVKVAPEVIATD